MSKNRSVFGTLVLGAIIGYLGILIIKSMSLQTTRPADTKEEDPFDTTELTRTYIYDHSQIKK